MFGFYMSVGWMVVVVSECDCWYKWTSCLLSILVFVYIDVGVIGLFLLMC